MFKRRVCTTAALTLLIGVTPVASAAQSADADNLTMIGTGTLSPGYPTVGCAVQTDFTFTGDITIDAGDDALDADGDVPYTAHWEGNSGLFCETVNSGQGTFALAIADGDGNAWTSYVNYARTGTELQIFGQVEIRGILHNIVAGTCEFEWTDVNPSTSYAIQCNLALDA